MKLFVILFACSALTFSQPSPPADAPAPTFKSGVSNVKIDVQAVNNRELIPDLTIKDFVLFDQDRQRELLFVDRGAEPLSLVLLIDVSGSMKRHVEAVADVAVKSLGFLRPSDSVAVVVFGKTAKTRLGFTTDRQRVENEIRASVNDQDVGAETAINNALTYSADYLEKHAQGGRRAVLILTDNLGVNVRNPDEKVIDQLLAANAVLNAIVVGNHVQPDPTKPRPTSNPAETLPNVYYIAQETGGEAVQADNAAEAFPSMVERIRLRYSLQYKTPPGSAGTFRKVRVELTPEARMRYPNARLLYRRGYYYTR